MGIVIVAWGIWDFTFANTKCLELIGRWLEIENSMGILIWIVYVGQQVVSGADRRPVENRKLNRNIGLGTGDMTFYVGQ